MSYKDRQQSIKLLEAGYAENEIVDKLGEIKRTQALQAVQLNEVEQNNPSMMIAAGYRVLDELNKQARAETETTIQLGGNEVAEKDAELQAVEKHLDDANAMSAKMDAILELIKQQTQQKEPDGQ